MSNFVDKIPGADVSKFPEQTAAAPHHFAADKPGPSFAIHMEKAGAAADLNNESVSGLEADEEKSSVAFKQANADYVAAEQEFNKASMAGDIAGMDKAEAKKNVAWDALQHAKEVRESFNDKWAAIAEASHSGEIDTLSAQVLQNLFKAPTENDKMARQVAAKLLASKEHSVQAGASVQSKCNNGSSPIASIGCGSGAPTKHVLTLLNSQPAALDANTASPSSAPIGREITIQSTGFQTPLESEAVMGPQPYSKATAPTQLSGDQAVVFPGQQLSMPYVNTSPANRPPLQLSTVSNGINPASAGQPQNLAVSAAVSTASAGAVTGNNSAASITQQVSPGGNAAVSAGSSSGGPVQSGANSSGSTTFIGRGTSTSNSGAYGAASFSGGANSAPKVSSRVYAGYTPQEVLMLNAQNAYYPQTGNFNSPPVIMTTGGGINLVAPVNPVSNPVSEGNSVATQTGTGSFPVEKIYVKPISVNPVSFPEGSGNNAVNVGGGSTNPTAQSTQNLAAQAAAQFNAQYSAQNLLYQQAHSAAAQAAASGNTALAREIDQRLALQKAADAANKAAIAAQHAGKP